MPSQGNLYMQTDFPKSIRKSEQTTEREEGARAANATIRIPEGVKSLSEIDGEKA